MSSRISRRHFLTRATTFASFIALGGLNNLRALAAKASSKWDAKMELEVAFEINKPEGGRRYQRPYVAVWLEDANGKPVRTLSLWFQTGKGNRWLPDLKRWFKAEEFRKSGDGGDLTATLSGPTREPGTYKLVWDGKNDKKTLVDQGEYFLCIEAAREHGTYQLIREKLEFFGTAFNKTFVGNEEIKGASVAYRKI
jgi:FAD:protein FMN transferase